MIEERTSPGSYLRRPGLGVGESDINAERLKWLSQGRRDASGKILSGVYAKALEQRWRAQRNLIKEQQPGLQPGGPGSVNWTPLGPSVIAAFAAPYSGRITCLASGPSGNRAYAGSDNGGVWFSGDGGTSWAPLDDYIVSPNGAVHVFADALSVGSLAVKFGPTAANDEIYVGTGGWEYFGIGVRHSAAGGAPGTWSLEATNLGDADIRAIVIDPDNSAIVLAATFGTTGAAGLYMRPIVGSPATWTHIVSPAFTNPNGWVSDLIVAGSGKNKKYYAAFWNDKVYSSPDAIKWTAITGIAAGSGNIVLAAGESDPSAVYALTKNGTLYELEQAGFQFVAGTPSAAVLFPLDQGNFDLVVAVDPTNAKTIYLVGEFVSGDLALFKSTLKGVPGNYDFGFNPLNAGNPSADPTFVGTGIHPDGHSLVFGLNALGTAHDPTDVWVGCDGGVYRSVMGGLNSTFKPRNTGLSTAELNYLAQRYDTDAVVFAGAQDNGTVRYLGEQALVNPTWGDGGGVAVDPNNPYQVMHQFIRAELQSSSDGGFTFPYSNFPPATAATQPQWDAVTAENKATGFYAPIVTTPAGVLPTLAAFGTNRLWLTADWGNNWVTLPSGTNPYTPAIPNAAQDVIDGNPITAIAFASPALAFAATYQTIWRYDKVGPNWSRTIINTGALPNWRHITSIAVDDPVAGSFYATTGNGGLPHLYYFDGANWTPAMPTAVIDAPAWAVVIDPSNLGTLYVGTDVGCWKGKRTGPASWNWAIFSQGLPEAAIHDLKIHDRARLLRASTHGRGLWEISLTGAADPTPDVYMRANYCDTGRVSGAGRNTWIQNLPDPTRQNFNVYHWMSADVKVRRGSLPGLPTLGSPADYYDYAVNIGDYADSTTNTMTADVSGPNRIFVEVHNRDVISSVPAAQVRVLLLLADASAGLPALPANYASHINGGDPNPAWLAGTQWHFADPASPYRTTTRDLDVRTPQVVEFDVDFSLALPLPPGHEHACALAFVTTPSDPITAVDPSPDSATMLDKHIALRNIHLVVAGATPIAPQSDQYGTQAQVALLDIHNPLDREQIVDIIFERKLFPGHLSVMLPRLLELTKPEKVLDGFKAHHKAGEASKRLEAILGEELEHLGDRIEALGESIERGGTLVDIEPSGSRKAPDMARIARKIAKLDQTILYVAESMEDPAFKGIRLPAKGFITAALIFKAPMNAVPGDKFALHVIQRCENKTIGGSSYVFIVTTAIPPQPKKALPPTEEIVAA